MKATLFSPRPAIQERIRVGRILITSTMQNLSIDLLGDPRFRGPIRLWMGRFEPVEVDVFVRLR